MSAQHLVNFQRFDSKDKYGKINLIQIGRLVCNSGHVIAKHNHLNWFEITCVVDGEGEIYGGNKTVSVKKGDIFLSFPCEGHGICSSKQNPLTFDHFAFYCENSEYNEILERIMACYASPEKRLFKNHRIKETLEGCIVELQNSPFFLHDFLLSSFSIIVLELFKIFRTGQSSSFISDTGYQEPEKLCKTLKNYIDTHLFSISSLHDLSVLCGYNYSYLSFLFKKITGTTLSDYYKEKRFESAKLMICENRLKIGEISNLLGYSSVYAFSKAFKDEFGISPKNYYKEINNTKI